MSAVKRMASGITAPGRFFCRRVAESCSISSGSADHTATPWPLFASIRARAMPQVPAPNMPIFTRRSFVIARASFPLPTLYSIPATRATSSRECPYVLYSYGKIC